VVGVVVVNIDGDGDLFATFDETTARATLFAAWPSFRIT
jgi:hypothetical protein